MNFILNSNWMSRLNFIILVLIESYCSAMGIGVWQLALTMSKMAWWSLRGCVWAMAMVVREAILVLFLTLDLVSYDPDHSTPHCMRGIAA